MENYRWYYIHETADVVRLFPAYSLPFASLKDAMERAERSRVYHDSNIRVSSSPLNGGDYEEAVKRYGEPWVVTRKTA